MIKKTQIVYELAGANGLIALALQKQAEGSKVDVDLCYRAGAACYHLAWYEQEKSEDDVVVETTVEPEDSKPEPDWDFVKSLKDLEDAAEAKLKLIEYAGTFGIPADKFDKRKSLDKLHRAFAGHISQKK